MKFQVGDHVFLKASFTKDMMRFGVCGKLRPKHVSLFEILEIIRIVTHHLALPPSLARIYNVFDVSVLRKYIVLAM